MSTINLNRLRDFLPKQLPRLPSWTAGNSTNAEDDETLAAVLAEPKPRKGGPKTYIELLHECDNFPYYQTNPKLYFAYIHTYYALYVKDFPDTELGYILPSVVEVLRGLKDWSIDDDDRSLTLITGSTEAERTRAVEATTRAMQATGHFHVLAKWRDEIYPVYGPNGETLFNIERSASPLFGVVTYGAHMTAYFRTKSDDDKDDMKIWVPRRAATKQTYPSMLDNTVAGGIATGESPLETIVRESTEEASLPEEMVRTGVKAVGMVTYFYIRDYRTGGETRLLQPECQYVYDLEVPPDFVPKPSDDEVEGFELKPVDEVKQALINGEFKPNCAAVLLDFFVRHGILTAETEPDYIEIITRLHRKLEFPVVGKGASWR